MSRKCINCQYSCGGERDCLSDICDSCCCDPDTGWGGFTDHSLEESVHFNSEEEQDEYYRNNNIL